jgi:hypothetical protein
MIGVEQMKRQNKTREGESMITEKQFDAICEPMNVPPKPQTCYDCRCFSMCKVQDKLAEFIAVARIAVNDETIRMIRERIGADCEMFAPLED